MIDRNKLNGKYEIFLYCGVSILLTCVFVLLFIYTPLAVDCWNNNTGSFCAIGFTDTTEKVEEDETEKKTTNSTNISKKGNDEEIPDKYKEKSSSNIKTTVSFEHNTEGNQIFQKFSHDAMVTDYGNNGKYIIVGRDGKQELYKTRNITNKSSWNLNDGNFLSDIHEADDITKNEDTIIVHTSDSVYTTNNSLSIDNWTKRNVPSYEFEDSGIYYDSSEDKYHVYYEKGNHRGLSGDAIGHAVSPNGVNNWTVYPEVWNGSNSKYGVGDFDIVEVNNTIIITGDYDKRHPKYNIGVWTNDDPYTKFDMNDNLAIEPRNSNEKFPDNFGISDPELVKMNGDSYYMIANGHNSDETESATLHMYKGTIKVEN